MSQAFASSALKAKWPSAQGPNKLLLNNSSTRGVGKQRDRFQGCMTPDLSGVFRTLNPRENCLKLG